eukprot:gene9359-19411_t
MLTGPVQPSASPLSKSLLNNDLQLIKSQQHSLGYSAEPVNGNVFMWRVFLNHFNPNSNIVNDLAVLKSSHGYSNVELQISFAMDLHSSFPPLVTIVKPWFLGSTFSVIGRIESLKLKNWDPVIGTRAIIEDIRKELENHGRVDIRHPMNGESSTSTLNTSYSNYNRLEHLLLKLSLVTGIFSRLQLKYVKTCREKLNINNNNNTNNNNTANNSNSNYINCLGKGTTQNHLVTDLTDVEVKVNGKKRKATDNSQESTTDNNNINNNINNNNNNNNNKVGKKSRVKSQKTAPVPRVLPVANQRWAKGTGYGNSANCTVAEQDRLKRNLLTQVLSELKIAIRSVQNNKHSSSSHSSDHSSDHSSGHVSSLDMVYSALEESCLLPLIEEQLRNESLLDMERHRESYSQQEPINSLLGKLGKRLSIYKKQTSKVSMDMASSVDEDALMRIIQRVLVAVEEVVERQIIPSSNSTSTSHLKSIVDLTDDDVFVEGQYKSVMQGLQYDEAEELYEYHYRRFASTVSNTSSKRVKRLAQEHADLSHSLPLSLSSSVVWVRCSSSRMDMLQTIISGPDDTPYSNGLFLFDAYFPDNYPSVAPNVNLQTTGSGTVCLSLLGTWEGKDGETWNENTSTFLQVLVSIQSLIFVPDPYFNEPGFEAYMGTPRGVDLSRNYNEEKREETVKW